MCVTQMCFLILNHITRQIDLDNSQPSQAGAKPFQLNTSFSLESTRENALHGRAVTQEIKGDRSTLPFPEYIPKFSQVKVVLPLERVNDEVEKGQRMFLQAETGERRFLQQYLCHSICNENGKQLNLVN